MHGSARDRFVWELWAMGDRQARYPPRVPLEIPGRAVVPSESIVSFVRVPH